MIDELTLKYTLKQRLDAYNADQKSLYFNSVVFRVVLVIIIIVVSLLIIFLFILPITTPLFLKNGVISDVISLSCSGCMISMLFFGSVTYFVAAKVRKKKTNIIELPAETETDVSLDDLLTDHGVFEQSQKTKKKQHFFSKHLKFFSFVREFFSLMFSILFVPIQKKEYLYLDKTKIDFAVCLVQNLIRQKNCVLNLGDIQKDYQDYSNTWIANTLKVLVKIKIINICDVDTGEKVILLNLDFYNPEEIAQNDN